jgi:hypothetical protein
MLEDDEAEDVMQCEKPREGVNMVEGQRAHLKKSTSSDRQWGPAEGEIEER